MNAVNLIGSRIQGFIRRSSSMLPENLKPVVGVIGGSGLYSIGLKVEREVHVDKEVPGWPFGPTSSPVVIATLSSGQPFAFIARHGFNHTLTPTEVPSRANIAALKYVGAQAIIAFSAVGSLQEEIKPRDLVVPDQINRTKGIRPSTFFENGVVAHATFGEPFDVQLSNFIIPLIKDSLKEHNLGKEVDLHTGKTLVCMEGPQFSTRAESKMYRQWGGDIINMSTIPEAKLAREAELSYALVCTSTDYDAWRVSEEPVTVAEVMKVFKANADVSKHVTSTILSHVHDAILGGQLLTQVTGAMKHSIVSHQQHWPEEARAKLEFLFPEYFGQKV